MNRRIGRTGLQAVYIAKLATIAAVAGCVAFAAKCWAQNLPPLLSGFFVLLVFGILYSGSALMLKVPEATQLLSAVLSGFRNKP
jgi:hypothetical protein